MFYRLLLVTGRIRDIGQNFYRLHLVTKRMRDIGQNVLPSSSGNWANTWRWTERFTFFFWYLGEYVTLDRTFCSFLQVTGRVRDIGHNVLPFSSGNWASTWHWTELFKSSFQSAISSNPTYCNIFFSLSHSSRMPLLEYRIIITQKSTYKTVIIISNNNNY